MLALNFFVFFCNKILLLVFFNLSFHIDKIFVLGERLEFCNNCC